MKLVAQVGSRPRGLLSFREQRRTDLMDLRLPTWSGIDAMVAIRSEFPEARIIVLTDVRR